MRNGSWLSILAVLGAGASAVAACSSSGNVTQATTGTGGAGGVATTTHATTVSTTVATTSATTGVGGAGGTGGAGVGGAGGNACNQACAKAKACGGVDICSQAKIDCSKPQYDCSGKCLLAANCTAIDSLFTVTPDPTLRACLTACQSMGTTSTGSGAGGGGSPMACSTCGFQQCFGPGQMCTLNPDCQAWLQCTGMCADPACFTKCDAAHPTSKSQQGAVYACLCKSCDQQCGSVADPCSKVPDGG